MACPLFVPGSRLGDFAPGPTPLGDAYGGECSADPGALIPIDTLRRCCNSGYARESCPRAARAEADAARFMIKADSERTIRVAWSLERNHHPVAVGTMEFPIADCSTPQERTGRQSGGSLCAVQQLERTGRHSGGSSCAVQQLERQARAYVDSYLRAKGRA